MWNQTSSSTVPSSDVKQNINEIVGIHDCKCAVGKEPSDPQQKNNCKRQTATFGGQATGSTNNQQQHYTDGLDEESESHKIFSVLAGTTIDSGFISGSQTSYSTTLDTDNEEAGDIKKLNIPEFLSESQEHNNTQQQFTLASDPIEEGPQKNTSNESNLPRGVESDISDCFCNLSLHKNPNANSTSSASKLMSVAGSSTNKQQNSVEHTKTPVFSASCHAAGSTAHQCQQQSTAIPQQITPAYAWEIYYQQNDDGNTYLHLACISGYEDIVAALIRIAPHPCLFNIQNDDVQTPLHLATLTGHPKIIRMLLIVGAKPTVRDRYGNTALHLACMSGEEQCVRALVIPVSASEFNEAQRQYGHRLNDKSYIKYAQLLPPDLEIRNYDGERCVHLAAQAGFINILRILVLCGANINAREGKSGRTLLHMAIETCNEDLANYLLYDCQKLNLETTTYAGLTAYQVACVLNKSEMQNSLEKRGAELLTPPDSDYDSSDIEIGLDDSDVSS